MWRCGTTVGLVMVLSLALLPGGVHAACVADPGCAGTDVDGTTGTTSESVEETAAAIAEPVDVDASVDVRITADASVGTCARVDVEIGAGTLCDLRAADLPCRTVGLSTDRGADCPQDGDGTEDPAASGEPKTASRSSPVAVSPSTGEVWMPVAAAAAAAVALPAPLWSLHRRITKDRLLANDNRRRVLEVIRSRPGLRAGDVADEIGASYHAVRYHLDILADFDEVTRRQIGGELRFFPNHRRLTDERAERLAALAEPRRAEVLDAIRDRPGRTTSEVAETVGVAASTASFHLDRLEEVDLVRRRRDGMAVRNYPAAEPPSGQ